MFAPSLVRPWSIAAAFVAGGSAAALVAFGSARLAPAEVPARTLEGAVPPATELPIWLEGRRALAAARPLYLELPNERTFPVTLRELGHDLDVAETGRVLGAPTVPTPRWLRVVRDTLASGPPAERSVTAHYRFEAESPRRLLEALASVIDREPVDAKLDFRGHRRIAAQPGRRLDIDRTLARIAEAPAEAGTVIPLAVTLVPPRVTEADLLDVDPALVLSAYETDFAKRGGRRVDNIVKARDVLDGLVLRPGEIFSYDRALGPRTLERGFVNAPVIVADEMEDGVGGGVCQVASTLHAAALFGGLEVVTRRSHSRPTGYTPLGLDAVVVEDEVDLRIRNPYPTPLVLHVSMPSTTRVRVEFLGRAAPRRARYDYSVTEQYEFVRKIVVRPELPPERHERKQKGIRGFDVVSHVTVEFNDGESRVRRYRSKYYPVPEIYWVSSDFDPSRLPELPEGASGSEWVDPT